MTSPLSANSSRLPLPPPRSTGTYRIGFVCLGNICRSPMADVVMSDLVDRGGLSEVVSVHSSGTGGWHVGKPMDDRAAAILSAHGYDPRRHRARQFDASWLAQDDLTLTMDSSNLADVRDLALLAAADDPDRIRLFRDFDPVDTSSDVPDPYYGGTSSFEEVLTMVERTCATLLAALEADLEAGLEGGRQ